MDTVSNALCIVLNDLAIHQNVQERLWNEIHEKLDNEELTYEKINELEYLVNMKYLFHTMIECHL